MNQWYGLTTVPANTVQQQAIPAVVAVQPAAVAARPSGAVATPAVVSTAGRAPALPRTGVMGAAAAPADARTATPFAQTSPVRDAIIVTTPLEPSPWRLPRR